MNTAIHDWLRDKAVKTFSLQEKTDNVNIQVIQDLAVILMAQGDDINPFVITIPQISVQRIYSVLTYLFGTDGKNFVSANNYTKYSSDKRNAKDEPYSYFVHEKIFTERELDITLEERFVFEILFFVKFGKRPNAEVYCCTSPTPGTLWWPKILSPVYGKPLSISGYCCWS